VAFNVRLEDFRYIRVPADLELKAVAVTLKNVPWYSLWLKLKMPPTPVTEDILLRVEFCTFTLREFEVTLIRPPPSKSSISMTP